MEFKLFVKDIERSVIFIGILLCYAVGLPTLAIGALSTHLLCGGYKLGLHVFQGGERHHGRFGTPEEEKGGGGAGVSNCRRICPRDAALEHALR